MERKEAYRWVQDWMWLNGKSSGAPGCPWSYVIDDMTELVMAATNTLKAENEQLEQVIVNLLIKYNPDEQEDKIVEIANEAKAEVIEDERLLKLVGRVVKDRKELEEKPAASEGEGGGIEMKQEKIHIGDCCVDSGQLLITDPCYLNEWVNNDFQSRTGYKDKHGKLYAYRGHVSPRDDLKTFNNYEEHIIVDGILASVNNHIEHDRLVKATINPENRTYSYAGACDRTTGKIEEGCGQLENKIGAPVGVAVPSGYGDGVYPVYAIVEDGIVVKIEIDLD